MAAEGARVCSVKFFLDTGLVEDVRRAQEWGIVDGITTNPSLIAKSGRSREEVVADLAQLVDGPISAEVIAEDRKGMETEARALANIHPNIVVKLPLTPEGIGTCKWCHTHGINTNVTLCFSANQALLAAKVGATYISPFIGRIDDTGHDGLDLIQDIRQIYDNYDFPTEILAASIRTTVHVREAALMGAHVATMPLSIMEQLFNHPLTDGA